MPRVSLTALLLAAWCLAAPAGAAAYTPREHALYGDGPSGRYLLDSGWSTRADQHNIGLREGWQRPGHGAGFRRVSIPNCFNARDHTAAGERSRVQWYRERFNLPDSSGATGWRIRFESVNVRADVWLNGHRLGSHVGAHLPFELDARGARRGVNDLVVRVDGRADRNDIPPAGRERGWWNYGGILREVYLRKVSAFDLGDPQVIATPGDPAQVQFSAMARNTTRSAQRASLTLDVSGPNGFAASQLVDGGSVGPGRLARVTAGFQIPNAALWSPQNPALYLMKVTLPGGQVTQIHFGVRQWSKAPDGRPLLNGQPLSLRGASFHEDTLARGAALRPSDETTIADELTALGANFSRQHYPPSPALLEAFDRLGIVFWEQTPTWRLRGKDLARRSLRRVALDRLREAILRDRNHASVVAWSVANEIVRGGSAETSYLASAKGLIRRLDPTRFFAADQTVSPRLRLPAAFRTLDAFGISEYIGWYGRYRDSALRPELDKVHAQLPGVALFATEFGAEANRSGPASRKGTYAFQQRFLDDHLTTMDQTPYLGGAIVWLLRDYAVRPGWRGGNPNPSPPFGRKGLIDLRGRHKPAWDVVKRHFQAVPPTQAP
jgi:beta-glucuronidase